MGIFGEAGPESELSPFIRPAIPRDLPAISALVIREFRAAIAPGCDEAANAKYESFASSDAIWGRLAGDSESLVATISGEPVGYLEMRDQHIVMLFVKREFQRQGVARRLLDQAKARRFGAVITVNSAPFAEVAYEHLGFHSTGERTVRKGVPFQPMALQA